MTSATSSVRDDISVWLCHSTNTSIAAIAGTPRIRIADRIGVGTSSVIAVTGDHVATAQKTSVPTNDPMVSAAIARCDR